MRNKSTKDARGSAPRPQLTVEHAQDYSASGIVAPKSARSSRSEQPEDDVPYPFSPPVEE
jgi:hypothetical protein